MMRQYWAIKNRYPGTLLLFRLGDFYETFGEDAVKTARTLGITLTSRGKEAGSPIPLAGIPFHSVEPYIDRLVAAGFKVAICEQLEDPAKAKGIVRRDVVRVVTPGTMLSERLLEANQPNYLAALNPGSPIWGLAVVDLSTGEFRATELESHQVSEEIERLAPAELLVPHWVMEREESLATMGHLVGTALEGRDAWLFEQEIGEETLQRHFGAVTLDGFGLHGMGSAIGAAGAVLHYLQETQKSELSHIRNLRVYRISEFMHLDRHTRRNLELVEPMDPEDKETTLVAILNRCGTRMGSRLLRRWILEPLVEVVPIDERLDAVEELKRAEIDRATIRDELSKMGDIERLAGRVGCGTIGPRDLLSLAVSLEGISRIKPVLEVFGARFLQDVHADLVDEQFIVHHIRETIADQPPATMRAGGYIRRGHDEELDRMRSAAKEGKSWLASLQQQERERTGIPNLKVGYNRVFGYYLEITKPHLAKVPEDYIRKQTLTNAERFFTAELKEKESQILGTEERALQRESELFKRLISWLEERLEIILRVAGAMARLDVSVSLAQVAHERNYCRPTINRSSRLVIMQGRHPVVEALSPEPFVPNDLLLDSESQQIILLTGPNMAGKSTYLRQAGLLVLLTQMGSFVPAHAAEIGLVDRVFTRVGASDRLARGQSTFLVEMIETANILHHATTRSLVLLDEIGRGTSTYDGLSIAWAVAEKLHEGPLEHPWTLFATHYHELTVLEKMFPRIKNYNVAVKREGSRVLFLHRIRPGAANSSYGIEVARLASLPEDVLTRAAEILEELEGYGIPAIEARKRPPVREAAQLELFGAPGDPVKEKLDALVVEQMTPLQALNVLHELKRLSKRERS